MNILHRCNIRCYSTSQPKRVVVTAKHIQDAMAFAKQLEKDRRYAESVVAWDTVSELISSYHNSLELEKVDPLEAYCAEDESALECRIYDV